MDIEVKIGQTKTFDDVKVISQTFTSALGETVAVLLQVHATPEGAKTLEKEAISTVKNSLLETDGEAASRLDGTLKELNGLLKGLLIAKKVNDVHAIITILDEHKVLHVSHAGRAEAYVIRGGSASQITEYTRGKPTPAFVHIASGALESRDIIVFSTQRLLRTFTPAQLVQLAQRDDQLLTELKVALEAEKEVAALATFHVEGFAQVVARPLKTAKTRKKNVRRGSRARGSAAISIIQEKISSAYAGGKEKIKSGQAVDTIKNKSTLFLADLKDPKKKRKAHLLLLAGILVVFIGIWATVNLTSYSQRSKTKIELEQLISDIEQDIQTAENRYLTGEVDSSNALLQRAEERAKQVMDNENKLFRTEAHDLLGRIRAKSEEINNIVRLSPRTIVNISAKTSDILAIGMVGLGDGEFYAYDRQDSYHILLNALEDPKEVSNEELISDATEFERYQTIVYQTDGNSLIEMISGQPTPMKTEDMGGWITGVDIEAYLRFLYVLSPENNQIYKYERFSNRYSSPTEYNVNGDLSTGLDMAIDGNVYVLSEDGVLTKLFRGEAKPFVVRQLPEGAISGAKKLYKVFDGYLYILDPINKCIVVVTDGGATGEANYIRQYVLEGEIGELQDLYVDEDETKLYVMDEKSLYAIDLK
ncbi:MAG: hypothetical protein KAS32_21165 [Candidatus Peribacteraceae bacterium]|nr:hypothetical protein [Candidatus Peribacteraceae bacterium]